MTTTIIIMALSLAILTTLCCILSALVHRAAENEFQSRMDALFRHVAEANALLMRSAMATDSAVRNRLALNLDDPSKPVMLPRVVAPEPPPLKPTGLRIRVADRGGDILNVHTKPVSSAALTAKNTGATKA